MRFLFVKAEDVSLVRYQDSWICPLINIWGKRIYSKNFVISEAQKDLVLFYYRVTNFSLLFIFFGLLITLFFCQIFAAFAIILLILFVAMYFNWKIIEIALSGEEFSNNN